MIWRTALTYFKKQGTTALPALRDAGSTQQSRTTVVHTLFIGALALAFGAFISISINFVVFNKTHLAPRIVIVGLVLGVMVGLYGMLRRGHYKPAAYGLLVIYFFSALGVVMVWSVLSAVGILMFALFIIFAGVSLGARYSLYAFLLVAVTLLGVVVLVAHDVLQPDIAWTHRPVGLTDITVYTIVFGNLSLISWLFNRSMEHSLRRAERSEKALRRQKQLLEIKVEERTRQVQAAHLERMQELHRFAELGHMSVALLHDMANYLTVLSLDIEDLTQARQDRSAVMRRIQQGIRHLNSLVNQARYQIKGESARVRFNMADEIDQVMKLLEYKANAQHVHIGWQEPPKRHKLFYKGSVNHFWQIGMNIISNALDAYEGVSDARERRVLLRAEPTTRHIVVSVTDFGSGIAEAKQTKIFEPFYSTKPRGSGMGLAIAKRMIEKDFGGRISVSSTPEEGTTFTITFPR